MRELSLIDTQSLVDSYVKTFGQRGAARKLTEHGYRSPEGHEIKQGHVSRIMNGSYTMLQAPEEPPIEPISAPTPSPIAPRPPVAEPYPKHCIESGPALASPSEGEEIEPTSEPDMEDLSTLQEDEPELPPLVPAPGDHTRGEHAHPQRLARPHAVFNRRKPVEIKTDEEGNEETYFGIPKLVHKPPTTMSRPYQPKSYGQNVVSTR